jgi:hypothetical protein
MATGPVSFNELPAPLRVGVVLAGGGGLAVAFGAMMGNGSPLLWVGGAIILGIMVVGSLLVVYARLLKWYKARQAKPMESQVLGSTGASPQGISDPQQLAKIDDLRRKFEEGIATFRTAGKTLYSLPWYVLLGEPGSGKTEAIRHCGIGFPPGLQDRYQGVGGTINMNWWFTDHGVILDTAGRLMFEEASTGGTREWKEFLGLLKKSRPSCPINGALLVIPSDSLICDDAEKIERKASQIAQQFDAIQRTLDVRFPVYVVITKSDLINGFREFFANISDPQLQHQILGWSNPGDMDKPYDPSFVDKYLEEMKTRLFRTRLTRLGELLGEEAEEQDRPMAEALYAFPHAFEQLGPRLKRYLDLIFSVGSQWSCKPLFFRGIYFTSSMQEGAALDQDLAQALGVPVESLPEGPVWKRDRAHFLRDLFLSKVFPERGLVTRATNARKQYARRQAAILGSAAVGLLVLLALTIYGSLKFRGSVQALQNSLEVAANPKNSLDLIYVPRDSEKIHYNGGLSLRDKVPLYAFFGKLADQAQSWKRNEGIPLVFRPAVWWTQKISPDQVEQAARQVYVKHALQPTLQAVAGRMTDQADPNDSRWTKDSGETRALHQLIAWRATGSLKVSSAFLPLMDYIHPVDPDDPNRARPYAEHMNELVRPGVDFGPEYSFDDALLTHMDQAIKKGVELFNNYWSHPNRQQVELLKNIRSAADDANNLDRLEKGLIGIAKGPNVDPRQVKAWLDKHYREMRDANDCVKTAKGRLKLDRLLPKWSAVAAGQVRAAVESYDELIGAFATADANHLSAHLQSQRQSLVDGRTRCTRMLEDKELSGRLRVIDEQFWMNDLYHVRFSMYETAVTCREGPPDLRNITIQQLPDMVDKTRASIDEARRKVRGQFNGAAQGYRVVDANQVAMSLIRLGEQEFYQRVVEWGRSNIPPEETGIDGLVQVLVSKRRYDPDAAQCVFSAWTRVKVAEHGLVGHPDLKKDFAVREQACKEYAEAYVRHWQGAGGIGRLQTAAAPERTWEEQHAKLHGIAGRPEDEFAKLRKIGKQLGDDQKCAVEWVQDKETVKKFQSKWAVLDDQDEKSKCLRVFQNWDSLGSEPLSARKALLVCPPDTFLYKYFVCDSRPKDASPDHYWYHLTFTSLELLAKEMANTAKSWGIDTYKEMFPLNKDGTKSLTRDDVIKIYELSTSAESPSVGASTAPGSTRNSEVDRLLQELRSAAALPAWVRTIPTFLPPPNGQYVCEVMDIKTTPPTLVRRVVISKGTKFMDRSAAGSDVWKKDEKEQVLHTFGYDCTKEAVSLKFYQWPEESKSKEEPATINYDGPWPWHRMMREGNVEPKNGFYEKGYMVTLSNNQRVTVTVTLRFSKKSGTEPIEIFPPMDQ